ncbi:hypothetical protein QBC37DRAFT_394200 [Rhypophila decipiens]|uniref:RNase H type-1 domain-containing protein n=1 Tax=Rhypophila decipiens TaxID=261697 RepID=A0AAN6YL66_9PEZI|nr:hypothetical protein QBC37DRAFT_394200 [Rhypophila decipiens]
MFKDFFSAVHSLAEDITTLSGSGEIFDSSFFDLTSAEEFLETNNNTSTANEKTKSAATAAQEEHVPPPSPDSDEDEEGDVFFDALENPSPLPPPPPLPPTPPPPKRTKEQIEAAIKSMIIIEKRKHAFPYAKFFDDDASPEDDGSSSDSGNLDMSSHLVIWTDASWHKDFAGVGLVFRNSQDQEEEWLEDGYTILPPFPKENFSYELLGIGLALKTAAEQVVASQSKSSERAPIKRVTIFNDSQDGIRKSEKHIRNYFGVPLFGPEQPVYGGGVQTLLTGAKSLEVLWDRGVEVEIRWSPGHCGIQENERADEVAKLAARYGFTSLSLAEPESESSLTEPISLTESESLPEPSQSSQSVKGDVDGLVDNNIEDVEEGLKKNGNGNVKSSIAHLVAGYVCTALGGLLASSPTPRAQVDSDSGTVVKDAGCLDGNGNRDGNDKPSTAKWVATLAAGNIFPGLGLSTSSPTAQVVLADSPPGSGLEGDRGVDMDRTVKLGNGKGQVRAEAISGYSLPPTPPDSDGEVEVVVVSSIEINKKGRGSRSSRKRRQGKGTDTSGTGTASTGTSATDTSITGTSGTSSELAHDGSVPLPFWLRAPRDYTCSTISGSGSGEQQKQESQPGKQPQQQQQEPQTEEQPQQKKQQQQQVEVKEQQEKASPRKAKILRILMPSSGQQAQEKPQQQQQQQQQQAKQEDKPASPSTSKFKILRIVMPPKKRQQQQAKKQEDNKKVRIMRLPVPVLRVVDEMMHMVDGMNDRTAPVKKLKQTMAKSCGIVEEGGPRGRMDDGRA